MKTKFKEGDQIVIIGSRSNNYLGKAVITQQFKTTGQEPVYKVMKDGITNAVLENDMQLLKHPTNALKTLPLPDTDI